MKYRRLKRGFAMELYSLERDNFVSQLNKIPDGVELVWVTEALLEEYKSYCGKHYASWKHNLKKGSKGVFVFCDGKPKGYGWLKVKGARDAFYSIGKGVAYLAEFFVDGDLRGKGIAPCIMSFLIIGSPEYKCFFISIYTTNVASRNALLKVGFTLERSLVLVRMLKFTLNKYKITCKAREVK